MSRNYQEVQVDTGAAVPGGFELVVTEFAPRAGEDCRELMGSADEEFVTDASEDYYRCLGVAYQFEGKGARIDTRSSRVYAPDLAAARALLAQVTFVYANSEDA